MAEDDYIGLQSVKERSFRFVQLVKLAEDMSYQDGMTGQLLNRFGRELVEPIVVALYGSHRGNLFQAADYFELTDVARVYDRVYAVKECDDASVKHAVCV